MSAEPWRVTWAGAEAEAEWKASAAEYPTQTAEAWQQLQSNPLAHGLTLPSPAAQVAVMGRAMSKRLLWLTPDQVIGFAVDVAEREVWILTVRNYPSGTVL
ncbi:MAG: hypothetical protein M3072_04900 [Candidatus Dormibacteraeota bacterium]|nr:hypothetical protein [Candidatus Dormibacteraeota bacterium]